MSGVQIGMLMGVFMLVMLALRIHVGISMFVAGAVGYYWISGWDALIATMKHAPYARFSMYDLSVVPLFLLMGQFATYGGLSSALFRATNAFIGHSRGGMAMAGVGAVVRFKPEAAGPLVPKHGWGSRFRLLLATWPVIIIFVAVLGGIYSGLFTATEAAAIGALATGLVAWKSGGLKKGGLAACISGTATGTGMIFLILIGADMLSSLLAVSQLSNITAEWVQGLGLGPFRRPSGGLLCESDLITAAAQRIFYHDIQAGTLVRLPVVPSAVYRSIGIIRRASAHASPGAQLLMEELRVVDRTPADWL